MKKSFLLLFAIFAAAIFSSVSAQVQPPSVSGDKDLRDNDVRMRSIELERAKRESDKTGNPGFAPTAAVAADIDKKYPQIKEDFESIQNDQDAIIKAYTAPGKLDYEIIKKSAEQINRNSKRLDENLFEPEAKEDESNKKEEKKITTVKDLIVDLDIAIKDFVSSQMFQNLRIVDPAVAGKARLELRQIIKISKLLSKEADKMK